MTDLKKATTETARASQQRFANGLVELGRVLGERPPTHTADAPEPTRHPARQLERPAPTQVVVR